MPHEQEMPAPVTTTILLHFATESERFARARRVDDSAWILSRLRPTVMVVRPDTCLRKRLNFGVLSRGLVEAKEKVGLSPSAKLSLTFTGVYTSRRGYT